MKLDLQQYLSSGIIELYCLGLASAAEAKQLEQLCAQYPAVRSELRAVRQSLLGLARLYEQPPPANIKDKIFQRLEKQELDKSLLADNHTLARFIPISRHSDPHQWQNLIGHITPPDDFDNIHFHPLFDDGSRQLYIAWARQGIPDEVHHDIIEKFLVLEGACTCRLGHDRVELTPGSFLEIPLRIVHNLRVTSPAPVKVILTKEVCREVA